MSRKKDGTFFFEDRACSAVRNASGAVSNIVTFIRDVSAQVRLEAMAESVSAMENIGAVFAGVRHEIGNPINNAKMMLTVLEQKLDALAAERVRYYVTRTLGEICRVEHLLMTLKSFNLFEAPQIADQQTGPILDLLRDMIGEHLRQQKISLFLTVLPGAGVVRADSRALQHVLLNLVTNAADALRDREDPKIEIVASAGNDIVRFRVADNGAGMDAAQLANLFKPFHTTKPNGTGLGLVIVKKMLQAMNGSIDVASKPNEGTVVTIDLPAGKEGSAAEADPSTNA
jgi:signal transduction histidine kinase